MIGLLEKYIKIEIYIHLNLTLSIWLNFDLILDWLFARRTLDIIRLIANLNTISWKYFLYHRKLLRRSRLYIQKIILLRLYLNMILYSIFILDMVLSILFWKRIMNDILIFVINVTDGDKHNFILLVDLWRLFFGWVSHYLVLQTVLNVSCLGTG